MAFLLFVLGIEFESIVYSATSLLLWIIIFAQSFYVQVPGDTYYTDYTMNAASLAFIFIDIVWLVLLYMNFKRSKIIR